MIMASLSAACESSQAAVKSSSSERLSARSVPFDGMRIVGGEREGETRRWRGERFDGMGRVKDKVEGKTAGALLLAGIGLEREREVLFEVGGGKALVILNLEAFGAVSGNGNDLCREERRGAQVLVVALAGFEQSGVDGLEPRLIVDLLGALALEDDGGDATASQTAKSETVAAPGSAKR